MVVVELVADGIIRRESGGFGRRRTERYPALDLLRAAAPRARIERMITAPRELERGGADLVERIMARMPGPLHQLLEAIGSSAAATSLTVRR